MKIIKSPDELKLFSMRFVVAKIAFVFKFHHEFCEWFFAAM